MRSREHLVEKTKKCRLIHFFIHFQTLLANTLSLNSQFHCNEKLGKIILLQNIGIFRQIFVIFYRADFNFFYVRRMHTMLIPFVHIPMCVCTCMHLTLNLVFRLHLHEVTFSILLRRHILMGYRSSATLCSYSCQF